MPARTELNSASDYHADSVTTGSQWIVQAYDSDSGLYGWQVPNHDWLNYLDDSDITFNTNSNIDWVDGTTSTDINIRSVALHELGHGVDLEHTDSANTIMFYSYSYSDWESLDADDEQKLQDIYD